MGGRAVTAVPTARAPRRYDPERKTRIIDATLEVIAEHGVAGTTTAGSPPPRTYRWGR